MQSPSDQRPLSHSEERPVRLSVEYAGQAFAGWQIQPDARTVQGELERALTRLLGQPPKLYGASRTDAGVHALGQTVSFLPPQPVEPRRLLRGLNAVLPDDVAVSEAEWAPPGFHARFSAKGKLYRYAILEREAPCPLLAGRVWHVRHALDLPGMQAAASHLVGRHDFQSFVSRPDGDGDCTRTLLRVEARRRSLPEAPGALVELDVVGDGFLYKMVRTIVGTLALVGRREQEPAEVARILAVRDRRQAGPTAPAAGLTLMRVFYDPAELARVGHEGASAVLGPSPLGL